MPAAAAGWALSPDFSRLTERHGLARYVTSRGQAPMEAGAHEIPWATSRVRGAGLYFVRAQVDGRSVTRKVVLTR